MAVHPESKVLQAFALGKLSDQQTDAVSRHLETCDRCREQLRDAPGDSFLGKVKAARPRAAATQMPRARPSHAAGGSSLFDAAPATTGDALEAPAELAGSSKFRLVKELGRGGMGVVYQAEHRTMERTIAIKLISQAILEHPDALSRFQSEVKAAARLNHPNIVQAFDAEQVGDLHMLVMEFVEGVSLADYLERKGPLPVGLACHFARQVALGLQHAYEKGMVHRDIKPRNLMVTTKGQVKILDFGLARLASERNQESRLTQLGAFMGTPEYVAPEQATDARAADIRADLYSLGCTLYCLLAGRPPFVEETMVQVVLAHLEQEPLPLRGLRSDVPEELWAVIARLLAKEPAARYQTPAEAAKELQPFAKVGAKAVPVDRPRPAPAAASTSRGTMIAGDTRDLPIRRATPPPLPSACQSATEFEGLDAVAKTRQKSRPAAERQRPAQSKRWALIGGAAAALAVMAGVAIWVLMNGNPDKREAPDKPLGREEATKATTPVPADTVVTLFNGKDLKGWFIESGDRERWRVVEGGGAITTQGATSSSRNWLLSEKEYSNFLLWFEYRPMTESAGSQVGYRCIVNETDRAKDGVILPFHPNCILVSDSERWPDPTGTIMRAVLVPVVAPVGGATKPVAEWNTVEMLLNGPSLRVRVNDQVVHEADLHAIAEMANPPSILGYKREKGRIGFLSGTADEVQFRNIRIKELTPR